MTSLPQCADNVGMKLLRCAAFLLAFNMFSCGSPEESEESFKGRRGKMGRSGKRNRHRPQPDAEQPPASQPPSAAPARPAPSSTEVPEDFMFPVEAFPGASLNINLNREKTVAAITPMPSGHSLRVVAGFGGTASRSGQNIILFDPYSKRHLEFELSGQVFHEIPLGTQRLVSRGHLLATTTGPVKFSVTKNGARTILCVSVVNETPQSVSVEYSQDSTPAACQ